MALTKDTKKQIFEKAGWKCFYCGREILLMGRRNLKKKPMKATVDHLVPRSKGGTDASENLVASCYKCNQEKADNLALPCLPAL